MGFHGAMHPDLRLELDDLTRPAVRALVARHLAGMQADTPPEDVHALGVDQLRAPDITFWSAWVGDEVVGCGALRRLDAQNGELKSMRVAEAWLGQGVGRAVLEAITAHARASGLTHLWLETGHPFVAARTLYERAGFTYCGPFGSYEASAFSVFMTRAL